MEQRFEPIKSDLSNVKPGTKLRCKTTKGFLFVVGVSHDSIAYTTHCLRNAIVWSAPIERIVPYHEVTLKVDLSGP
jgi:hypothetical protein